LYFLYTVQAVQALQAYYFRKENTDHQLRHSSLIAGCNNRCCCFFEGKEAKNGQMKLISCIENTLGDINLHHYHHYYRYRYNLGRVMGRIRSYLHRQVVSNIAYEANQGLYIFLSK